VIPILRFVILPAIIISGAAWWLILKHSRNALLPFLIVLAVILLIFRLLGFSPLAFFVSFGGYLIFAALAWIAAAIVREVRRGMES